MEFDVKNSVHGPFSLGSDLQNRYGVKRGAELDHARTMTRTAFTKLR